MSKIKVGIIEDDDFVRNEIVDILSESDIIEPLLSSESAENFLKYCALNNNIDFILTDIALPGMSGIEAIPKIKQKLPDAEIVILTSFKDNDNIFKALRAGASGYLLKDSVMSEIEDTLVNIRKGIPAISPAIARRMVNFFHVQKIEVEDVKLTEKETEVLKHLIDGLSYKLIANKMTVSINAIRYHVKNTYKKLHINSRPELLKLYMDGKIRF